MPQKVVLHVGSPKTGTTFLQQVLWAQRDRARAQGVLLPGSGFQDHYLASVDVRDLSYEPRFPARAIGMWVVLVEEAQGFDGTVLVSHELFAGATAEQALRAVGVCGDAEVHVVVTARDLVRQIPAEWQEHLKHRSAVAFADFVAELRSNGPAAHWFWTAQDCADICRRWGAAVPPERIHVVTVPPRGARPEALWERFAGLLGLDAASFDLAVSRPNRSLRAEPAELLRRVNARLDRRLRVPGAYSETVKETFAQELLAPRGGAPVALSGANQRFAVERSQRMADELRELGVSVVGDLAELVPMLPADEQAEESTSTEHPERAADAVLLNEAVEALSGLLQRLSDERGRAKGRAALDAAQRRTQGQLDEATAAEQRLRDEHEELLARLRTRPWRTVLLASTERRPRLMRLRIRYRRARGLLRRVASRVRRLRRS